MLVTGDSFVDHRYIIHSLKLQKTNKVEVLINWNTSKEGVSDSVVGLVYI